MRTVIMPSKMNIGRISYEESQYFKHSLEAKLLNKKTVNSKDTMENQLPEILMITSFPPRECGIATYSQDLRKTICDKFGDAVAVKICALENKETNLKYPKEVKYKLITSDKENYIKLAQKINADDRVLMVFLQHEFGLYGGQQGDYVIELLSHLNKPVVTTFHTILPNPSAELLENVKRTVWFSESVIVMTKTSQDILINEYGIPTKKIKVIPHGTHLVTPSIDNKKSNLNIENDRLVLSTFGLISEGKSIDTALEALPKIVEKFPNVLYLILGKTHPEVVKHEGERYREKLQDMIVDLKLQDHVRFVNQYLSLEDLIEYLKRTDIYLFTSKDPAQAVSGTFAYAMSCGCPIISTQIPHAKEFLEGAGINFDFQNSEQLADKTIKLLYDPELLKQMRMNALHKINPTAWQNVAIAHLELAQKIGHAQQKTLKYRMPDISLDHIKRMTTENGIIQFSKIDVPDIESGYTLDDNARALIAMTRHYQLYGKSSDLKLIKIYLDFILFCQDEDGLFLNYVSKNGNYLNRNSDENLEDSNGRAIWALGEFLATGHLFDRNMVEKAKFAFNRSVPIIETFHSPRAISFAIKGLYHYDLVEESQKNKDLITMLADNLVSKYRGVSDKKWQWYEEYLTYANSLLPEAMLYASMRTGNKLFEEIAKKTFDFLLSILFQDNQIKVVSNQGWHQKDQEPSRFGEQPIDVAYTVLALHQFYEVFKQKDYWHKMETAFHWFLGKNHLGQIVYNPCTGGCYDGLEQHHVNLNQGAESTLSYLLARLAFEKIDVAHYHNFETNIVVKKNKTTKSPSAKNN